MALPISLTNSILARDVATVEKIDHLLERVELIEKGRDKKGKPAPAETEAILGGVKKPKRRKITVSKAFKLYLDKIAFEDGMLEVGVDYGIRCYLMRHKNNRPDYGKKGSLEYRRDLLLKFVHPYQEGMIAPAAHMLA